MALLSDPAGQTVGTEVALHDEVGRAAWPEAGQPEANQLVKGVLADPDRWIAPYPIDHQVGRNLLGGDHPDVVQTVVGGITAAEQTGPRIDLDRPHDGPGVPGGEGTGDRAVAGSNVDDVPITGDRIGTVDEQEPGAGIDPVGGEHTAIGDQLTGESRHDERHRAGGGLDVDLVAEVVAHRVSVEVGFGP